MIFGETIESARKRFFPGWQEYLRHGENDKRFATTYRVECNTFDEYILAKLAKPSGINAEIIYKP